MHHAHVSSIEFIPLFVLSYLLTIERRRVLLLLLTIFLYALSALSCWYYVFYLAYFIAFHTIYVAIRDRALPTGWQLLTPVACIAGLVLLLSPILVPMVSAAWSGASVYEKGSDSFVADVLAYPAFPRFHLLAPLANGIYSRLWGVPWEATVYLGLVNVAVLTWWCFHARHKDSRLLMYVLCGMAVFCIFASGDRLHVLGHRIILMPGIVLSHLPFVSNVRTPSRAIVFVYMFLAIGIGHAAVCARQHWQGRMARWGMAAVTLLIVLDFFPARRLAMTPITCSPGLAVIRDDAEKGFGVLDMPSGTYAEGNFFMLQQAACHGRPILRGNTSRDVVVSLRDRLETRDLLAQQSQLAASKVKYIIIRAPSASFAFAWHPEDGPQSQYPLTYPVAYRGSDLTVLRVY
jgi:hypothetical protein